MSQKTADCYNYIFFLEEKEDALCNLEWFCEILSEEKIGDTGFVLFIESSLHLGIVKLRVTSFCLFHTLCKKLFRNIYFAELIFKKLDLKFISNKLSSHLRKE